MGHLSNEKEIKLATILQLGHRARDASSEAELRFLLLNETISLLNYRQAAFWSADRGVEALSGVSSVDSSASYTQWLNSWFDSAPKGEKTLAYQTVLSLLYKQDNEWQQWLPPFLVSVYLPPTGKFSGGRVMFAREQAFEQAELILLQEWCEIWRGEYQHHVSKNISSWFPRISSRPFHIRWLYRGFILGVVVAISQIPVHLSILAPAELISNHPIIVRAPMDGIVEAIEVKPNQYVKQGDLLFEFDRVSLINRLEVAKRSLATAEAEYKANAQRALFDAQSKGQLAILRSRVEEKVIEVNYLNQLNQRSEVRAAVDGLVILDDETEWAGRPAVTGERILMIADERDVGIEAWISPKDILPLVLGSKVSLFLSADPVTPLDAQLTYLAHQPELRPDGNYAYRARAELVGQNASHVRVGLKGTARIDGEQVSLFYWVARRPWAAVRTWLGI
ncbi:efflux RND transporter periplasmic adaptor subunit [Vibrio diazotrophicus]|uniref:efflux RND transporter periplasmic adaptor subunit n=1 Tax=Vibrio diazotrophicus TaxID=685 RepID=UPI000C9DB1DB|nr:efflux RND transporter periplasmic adaptor subunit [Vibrio diazotrophicus]PNH95403.1 secretion protein HylD [Vibrio diazotrophicus]